MPDENYYFQKKVKQEQYDMPAWIKQLECHAQKTKNGVWSAKRAVVYWFGPINVLTHWPNGTIKGTGKPENQ